MNLSPIVLFVYNRYSHLRRTVEALAKNELAAESDLFIFSDAPRSADDAGNVNKVREYIHTLTGFNNIRITERNKNLGLSRSIISGVTEIIQRFGKVIVLEYDLETSPYFLRYMNEALKFYLEEEKVISIAGYMYPVNAKMPDTLFTRILDCWGWATWKRGWDLFEENGEKLYAEIIRRNLIKEFDFENSFDFMKMLRDQIDGKNDSWAIRWYASAFLNEKLTLYPGISLVNNIGNEGTGRHGSKTDIYNAKLAMTRVLINEIPLFENNTAVSAIEEFFHSLNYDAYKSKIKPEGIFNVISLIKRFIAKKFTRHQA